MNRRQFLGVVSALPASGPILHRLAASTPIRSLSMWTYLWDIVDEGYTTPLQLMKENGLTHVSLASAYHAGRFLLPHNPKRKVYFLEDGTVYFKPTSSQYGRIKPNVNSLVNEGHDLARVRKEAERAGLGLNAWVVCCHNTPLGTKYPDIACVDAFGDPLYHNLCPSNEDVRKYLGAMVRDIASQGAGRIELEAMQFQGFSHGNHHEREALALTSAHRFMLGLCFCKACFKRSEGSINLIPIQRFVRKTLEDVFVDPASPQAYKTMEDLPQNLFAPFLEWRRSVIVSLAEELQESVRNTSTILRPLATFDATARSMVGMDAGRVAAVTGGVLMPGYVKDGAALREPLGNLQKLTGKNEVVVGFQVGLPESGGKEEFLSRMSTAREMGIRDFNFYNYGLIPLQNLGWIKEASNG